MTVVTAAVVIVTVAVRKIAMMAITMTRTNNSESSDFINIRFI